VHYHVKANLSSCLTDDLALDSIASELKIAPMKREKAEKKQTLNFRVSAEFKRRLIEEAAKERRSLTNYLENTFTRLWDEHQVGTAKVRELKRG
jgi:hypothetical protein